MTIESHRSVHTLLLVTILIECSNVNTSNDFDCEHCVKVAR
jgi:hypothetical protein